MIESLKPLEHKINARRISANQENQNIRFKVLEMCWTYLNDNFHKFNETNKLKVALVLSSKNIPQEISGMGDTKIIIVKDKEVKNPSRDTSGAVSV